MKLQLRRWSRRKFRLFSSLLFDPWTAAKRVAGFPFYVINLIEYSRMNPSGAFPIRLGELMYTTFDRFGSAGVTRGHYFHQDLWAARWLFRRGVRRHVDVGSRLDGFIAHLLLFCEVCYVDIRRLEDSIKGLEFRQGSATEMPFPDDSLETVSCLNVIEHVGLGRYGDPLDPDGHIKAARELTRVLKPGGALLLGTPIGTERLIFDAHRVFDPQTVISSFSGLKVEEFSFVDDDGLMVADDATFDQARYCEFGCGLFVFRK